MQNLNTYNTQQILRKFRKFCKPQRRRPLFFAQDDKKAVRFCFTAVAGTTFSAYSATKKVSRRVQVLGPIIFKSRQFAKRVIKKQLWARAALGKKKTRWQRDKELCKTFTSDVHFYIKAAVVYVFSAVIYTVPAALRILFYNFIYIFN